MSIQRQDDNNNYASCDKSKGSRTDKEQICPVLASILSISEFESRRHAMSGCPDCLEYCSALSSTLPNLLNLPPPPAQHCTLHNYTCDPELGIRKHAPSYHKEGKVVCYLAGVIMAILALVTVIVVLTMMIANQEMKDVNQF